jgi:hypothetical protein
MADPDFDRLADVCLSRAYDARGDGHGIVVEALRQVWNARGAADIEAVYATAAIAIKALDR